VDLVRRRAQTSHRGAHVTTHYAAASSGVPRDGLGCWSARRIGLLELTTARFFCACQPSGSQPQSGFCAPLARTHAGHSRSPDFVHRNPAPHRCCSSAAPARALARSTADVAYPQQPLAAAAHGHVPPPSRAPRHSPPAGGAWRHRVAQDHDARRHPPHRALRL